jgi:hypothetical protein
MVNLELGIVGIIGVVGIVGIVGIDYGWIKRRWLV